MLRGPHDVTEVESCLVITSSSSHAACRPRLVSRQPSTHFICDARCLFSLSLVLSTVIISVAIVKGLIVSTLPLASGASVTSCFLYV